MRTSPFLPLAALLLLAGCNRDAASDAPTTAAAPAAAPAPAAPAAGDDAGVTMRYACDGNTTVAILGSDSARVDLPDGPDVTLSKVAGSAPPVFTGADLYFAIGDSGAHLSQGDRTNELGCQAQ
jgi:hypothetical protein